MAEKPSDTAERVRVQPPETLDIADRADIFLRRVGIESAEPLFRAIHANAQYLSQYQGAWPLNATLESTKEDISERQEKAEKGEWLDYELIEAANPNVVIGKGTFFGRDQGAKTSKFGYWIVQDKAGHGYATSIAKTMIAYGFEKWGLERIICEITSDNEASQQVARNVGLTPTGEYRTAPEDGSKAYEVWEIVK
ncbi:MAG TPA: GNAT family protein [Candidatus Saccharimonadales bacterium]